MTYCILHTVCAQDITVNKIQAVPLRQSRAKYQENKCNQLVAIVIEDHVEKSTGLD